MYATEKIQATGQLLGWLATRMFFLIIVDLAAFGAWNSYQWYQAIQPQQIDVATLTNESLNELSKEILREQASRK